MYIYDMNKFRTLVARAYGDYSVMAQTDYLQFMIGYDSIVLSYIKTNGDKEVLFSIKKEELFKYGACLTAQSGSFVLSINGTFDDPEWEQTSIFV